MSLILAFSHPKNVAIKTYGFAGLGNDVNLFVMGGLRSSKRFLDVDVEIPLADFLGVAEAYLRGEEEKIVVFSVIEIDPRDFLQCIYYVLTNTNIMADDPRLKFVERVKDIALPADGRSVAIEFVRALREIDGFGHNGARLSLTPETAKNIQLPFLPF